MQGRTHAPHGLSRPPSVIRGVKLQATPDSQTIGLDWIRVVGPAALAPRVANWLLRRFGEPQTVPGRYRFGGGRCFGGVALLFEGHADGVACVEFNGSALASMEAAERVRILRRLRKIGFHATRLDVAIDFRAAERVGVLDCVLASCEESQLCGAKSWSQVRDTNAQGLAGWTIYLGKRGKAGSGRLTRIYDKGLETKSLPAGQWERFEVEFTKDAADKAAAEIVRAHDWTEAAAGLAMGAVDFRERRGVTRSLLRRPRCAWWQALVERVTLHRIKMDRRTPTLESTALWMRRAVGPTVQRIADEVGRSAADVYTALVGIVDASTSPTAALRASEFRLLSVSP